MGKRRERERLRAITVQPGETEDYVLAPISLVRSLQKQAHEPVDATPLNAAAMKYMADAMAMREPLNDQEQNWIFGHLVTFADRMVKRDRRLRGAQGERQ